MPLRESDIAWARSGCWTTVPERGLGMRPRRPRIRPSFTDFAHHVGGGDCGIEFHPAALDLLDDVVRPDVIGAVLLCGGSGLALGEYQDSDLLAGAVGEHGEAAYLLVGMTGVEAHAHVDLDGFVVVGLGSLLGQVDGLLGGVGLAPVDQGSGFLVLLASLSHFERSFLQTEPGG